MDNRRSVVEFVEEYRGLKYVSKFQSLGFRCGYVVIPDDILDKVKDDAEPDYECIPIDTHGGITFFGTIDINRDGLDCEWVIGFDCGHYLDMRDKEYWKKYFPEEYAKFEKYLDNPAPGTVKTQEFVKEECHKMIDQIIDIYYNDVTNCEEEPMNGEMFEKLSEKDKCSYLAQALSKKGGLHIADMPWAREFLVHLLDDRYNELYLEED